MIEFFLKQKIYDLYIYTKLPKEVNEYIIPNNIFRIVIKIPRLKNLIHQTIKNNIDILIYNFYNCKEIQILNNLKNLKTLFYIHQSFLYWIYFDYSKFISLYKNYQNSKYVINLIPFENDFLFKRWGIKSILMNNFISYEYEAIIPSKLSSKTILMIGRCENKLKRCDLGIKAMKYIIKEIQDCIMNIISEIFPFSTLKSLIQNLSLSNNIHFVGYSSKPETYFKNVSLHIFTSISESFGLVLCETKLFGIPNILLGLDYLTISNGGTIIIYDDNPETIAKESIKILKEYKYRKKLGIEARNSMKKIKNNLIVKKWNKIILSIYNGEKYYQKLREKEKKIPKKKAIKLIKNQLKLLKKRVKIFNKTTLEDLLNFTYMENLK
jgi:glycosyltransferase involved in cell wall biosynthesis